MIDLIKTVYWNLQPVHIWETIIGTKARELDWASKDFRKEGFCSSDHKHRDLLCERILSYKPFNVLEIGCNEGQNLFRLAPYLDGIAYGIDISKLAIKRANETIAKMERQNVCVNAMSALKGLETSLDKSVDVIFTDATLIYIGKDQIGQVLNEIIRVARKAIVLCEWEDFMGIKEGSSRYYRGCWVHDFAHYFDARHKGNMGITRINREIWNDKLWSKFGAIVEVRLD